MDKYDKQIAELTANPDNIRNDWQKSYGLFQFATLSGRIEQINSGCLTMIRQCKTDTVFIDPLVDDKLTKEIKTDNKIPKYLKDITVESLPVFAEWQRKLDVYRNKTN